MGSYCRICGIQKPNEKFSGKGHNNLICKKCSKLPREKREIIDCEKEMSDFLNQYRISDKNIKRLQMIKNSSNLDLAKLASMVIEVAQIAPYKKGRFKIIDRKRRDLIEKLEASGLILPYNFV